MNLYFLALRVRSRARRSRQLGAWKQMENLWAREIVDGKDVKIEIEAIFIGSSQRPDEFIVKYTVDGQPFVETFKNL